MKKISLARSVAASAAAFALGASLLPLTVAQAAPTVDGSSSDKAAASCYEIKKNDPSSKSGSYWLYTPAMEAPEQFYCDQETDGGGWVLIGRGREGWSEEYAGKGKAADLASNPDGTDAFTPVQLPSDTVNGLLDGKSPSDLQDGVRFKRAANSDGSAWQEVRAHRDRTTRWSWALQGYANWSNISFDNPAGYDGDASYASSIGRVGNWNNRMNAMSFTTTADFNWNLGFSYGAYLTGTNSSTSYLWTPTGRSAMPFTQVYLRPTLTQDDAGFQDIPDAGWGAEKQTQLPNNYSSTMKWRTSTESGTGATTEMNTRVQAISQVGNTVFTGGDFKNVVSRSGEVVDQGYLAGFDLDTQELVRGFTPKFNGQIKAIEGLSNGKLAVGGEFTEVNGEPAAGFVVLDPATGQIDHTFDWKVENRLTSGTSVVKTIQEKNGYLYIGGSFTHVKGATSTNFAYARNASRFDMKSGSVDWNWRPNFNGTVNGISAADDGSGVYAAGYFTTNGTDSQYKLAALDPTTGKKQKDWNWKLSYTNPLTEGKQGFQFDAQTAGDTVFTGGAEHIIAQYRTSDMSRISSSITKSGGDFQDISKNGDVIYGACHCGDWVYEGGETHDGPWNENKNIDMIRLIGAFDAKTGQVLPKFNPIISGEKGHGIWESFTDSKGNLWVGGDITKTMGASGVQNTVGFARYTPADVTPAAAPSNLAVTTVEGIDKLTWKSNTSAGTTYQVLRNNRVIATVPKGQTTFEIKNTGDSRYFVRSVDDSGNYSETTPVAVATAAATPTAEPTTPAPTTPAPTTEPTVEPTTPAPTTPAPTTPAPVVEDKVAVAYGDNWNYQVSPWFISNTWKNYDTTVRSWGNAATPMGWNVPSLKTQLNNTPWRQPSSIYLRKEITINNPADYQNLVLNYRSDDGTVLYVNGQEVKRDNMATGTITPFSLARSSKTNDQGINSPLEVSIPASSLKQGKNVIAVSVHGYRQSNAGVSFDMQATLKK